MNGIEITIAIGELIAAIGVALLGRSTWRALARNQDRAAWSWAQRYYALRDERDGEQPTR